MRLPWSRRRNDDLREELESHLQMATNERVSRGMPADEAAAAARREFGNLGQVGEVTRSMWGWSQLEDLGRELLHTVRALRQNPGFTVTAILILGLAIGMTTAVFGVFDAVIRRPLPVRDQDRVVVLWAANNALAQGQRELPLRYAQFQRFRHASRTLSETAAVINFGVSPEPITVGDRTLSLNSGMVSGNFFDVLGASPLWRPTGSSSTARSGGTAIGPCRSCPACWTRSSAHGGWSGGSSPTAPGSGRR